jgi:hypothetical protein
MAVNYSLEYQRLRTHGNREVFYSKLVSSD